MSVRYPEFQGEVVLLAKIHYANTNLATELQAVATALASDTTTHDRTIQTPPAGLLSDAPAAGQSRLTRDLLNLVNIAKAGNLPTASIIAAIDGVAGVLFKPGIIDVPAMGQRLPPCGDGWPDLHAGELGWNTVFLCLSMGGRSPARTSARTPAPTLGRVSGSSCIVTATNVTGSTAAPPSNAIATFTAVTAESSRRAAGEAAVVKAQFLAFAAAMGAKEVGP